MGYKGDSHPSRYQITGTILNNLGKIEELEIKGIVGTIQSLNPTKILRKVLEY